MGDSRWMRMCRYYPERPWLGVHLSPAPTVQFVTVPGNGLSYFGLVRQLINREP